MNTNSLENIRPFKHQLIKLNMMSGFSLLRFTRPCFERQTHWKHAQVNTLSECSRIQVFF